MTEGGTGGERKSVGENRRKKMNPARRIPEKKKRTPSSLDVEIGGRRNEIRQPERSTFISLLSEG